MGDKEYQYVVIYEEGDMWNRRARPILYRFYETADEERRNLEKKGYKKVLVRKVRV